MKKLILFILFLVMPLQVFAQPSPLPSFRHGYARNDSECKPEYAHLWKGKVGHWSMLLGITGIDNIRDVSGYGNHGTTGGAMTNDDWMIAPDFQGYVLEFDGTDDVVSAASNSVLDDLEVYTVLANVYHNTTGSDSIVSKSTVVWDWHFSFTGEGEIRGYMDYDTDADTVTPTGSYSADTWNHIAWTYDINGDRKIWVYLNGDKITTYDTQIASSGTLDSNVGKALLLGNSSGAQDLDGRIGDIRIYNRVLSEKEIKELHKTPYAELVLAKPIIGKAAGAAPPSFIPKIIWFQ